MTRRAGLAGGGQIAALVLCAVLAHGQSLKGANLSGAEVSSSKLPGVYGKDFVYPKPEEIAYFTAKGMNVFRVPVLWERLQPVLFGPLDAGELSRLTRLIDDARQHGASTIIDIHDYGRYRGVPIGQGDVTTASFSDLWIRLARRFGHDDAVLFGLMNEPQLHDAERWRDAEQQAIDGIRGTGAGNRILVSGIGWDGAHSFVSISGASLGMLTDPKRRLVFEVHQYFDGNSSGTTDGCVGPDQAAARLASFTRWLKANHHQGFLGEFGVSRRPECVALLTPVLALLQTNADVWLGWTYWAGGPRWGNYMFTLEPDHGHDRPQMDVLEQYLAKPP